MFELVTRPSAHAPAASWFRGKQEARDASFAMTLRSILTKRTSDFFVRPSTADLLPSMEMNDVHLTSLSFCTVLRDACLFAA